MLVSTILSEILCREASSLSLPGPSWSSSLWKYTEVIHLMSLKMIHIWHSYYFKWCIVIAENWVNDWPEPAVRIKTMISAMWPRHMLQLHGCQRRSAVAHAPFPVRRVPLGVVWIWFDLSVLSNDLHDGSLVPSVRGSISPLSDWQSLRKQVTIA